MDNWGQYVNADTIGASADATKAIIEAFKSNPNDEQVKNAYNQMLQQQRQVEASKSENKENVVKYSIMGVALMVILVLIVLILKKRK